MGTGRDQLISLGPFTLLSIAFYSPYGVATWARGWAEAAPDPGGTASLGIWCSLRGGRVARVCFILSIPGEMQDASSPFLSTTFLNVRGEGC